MTVTNLRSFVCVCVCQLPSNPLSFSLNHWTGQDKQRERERGNENDPLCRSALSPIANRSTLMCLSTLIALSPSLVSFFLQHSYSICYRGGVHTQTHRQRPKQNKREKERRHVSNTVSSTEGGGGGSDERQTHVRLGLNHVKRN